ncbi:MAG: hypothetical protein ACOYX5_00645 [Actinomycetota bacterium]
MMSDLNSRAVRRSLRALALAPAVLLSSVAAPALAAPPETWPDAEPVSAVDFLLVLLVIPLGIALVIALLASVPAMARGGRGGERSRRTENEWFGGPKDGTDAAKVESAAEPGEGARGGSSAQW